MFRDSTWTVKDQLIYKVQGSYYSFADVRAAAGTYRERKGASLQKIGMQQYRIRVVVKGADGEWTITGLKDAS
jgi:hypothetical protein